MADVNPEDKKKPHRKPHSGRKADKKTKKKDLQPGDKQRNPRAFGFNSAVRAERRFRRTQDVQTKKQHLPFVDRTPVEPPPVIVAVVGPPKVGKSTLIHCLIKNFTRQPLTRLKGPVTIVSGKKRRLTIMECNNDINCMIDIAKVADLVLLLVDASFGFEMEIFEFLNICQVHGMPRIMGILTHLDMLKHSKQLKRVKKTLKHRFWTEVYSGAKLFYLSGLIHGEYLRNEIKNLGRFISVMKFRPLIWRTSHPYVLVDRLEDITSPEVIRQNPVADRDVCLYGFVRGIPLNKHYSIHIPGCGDYKIKDVMYLPDPCPLPDKEKKRSLIEKEKFIYAPFSGVGGIVYDKDAVYVELGGSHSHAQEKESSVFVSTLMDVQEPLDKKIAHSELQLFSGAEPITAEDMSSKSNNYYEVPVNDDSGRKRRKVIFTNSDGLDESSDEADEDEEDDMENFEDEEFSEVASIKVEKEDYDEEEMDQGLQSKINQNVNKKYIWEDEEDENERDVSNSTMKEVSKNHSKRTKQEQVQTLFSDGGGGGGGTQVVNDKSQVQNVNARIKQALGDLDDDDDDDEEEEEEEDDDDDDDDDEEEEEEDDDDDDLSCEDKPKELIPDQLTIESHQIPKEKLMSKPIKWNYSVTNKIAECLASMEEKSLQRKNVFELEDIKVEEQDYELSDDERFPSFSRVKEKDDFDIQPDDESAQIEDSAVRWKSNLRERAANAFVERQANSFNLWKLVYGEGNENQQGREGTEREDSEAVGGLFRKVSREQKELQESRDLQDALDCSKYLPSQKKDWSDFDTLHSITDCFVSGKWKESEDAEMLLNLDNASVSGDSDVYGDFEDLETGEKHGADKCGDKADDTEQLNNYYSSKDSALSKKELIEKKRKLKEKFDAEYDEGEGNFSYYEELKQEVTRQAQLNKSEFDGLDDDLRVQLEGFRPGMYVRVELSKMPCELIENFDPTYPLIIGGLLSGEENVGYVQVRMKKHRWFSKILKNCDPLIVSLGWRRFQTIPVFAKLEDNFRHRYLKYTPQHVACIAHFWGPITPQGTGFMAIQDVARKEAGFRIAATGSVIELDKSVQIMKKLKLTGVPLKVYKKTAFIRGMFHSSLEVAKFEGAKLRTVSGIRGQIKRAVNMPEGAFRATFEDKIAFSDIVFCRTWYRFEIPKLYNSVSSLLLPVEKKNAWQGMKTCGQLKREKGIRSEPAVDSIYTPIEREPRVIQPLVIPSKLQRMLPYKDKPKTCVSETAKQHMQKRRVAVVREPYEQKVSQFMRMLKTSYEHKKEVEKKSLLEKKKERRKLMEKEEIKLLKRHKDLKRQVFRTLQKMEQEKEKKKKKKGKRK